MRRIITIGDVECEFKSSAAIPRMYRLKFKRDIFKDMSDMLRQIKTREKIVNELKEAAQKEGREFDEKEVESDMPIESLEMFENIAYLMHKHGDPSQPANIDEWLEQFEMLDIYEILPEIAEMWGEENQRLSLPKNQKGK